MLEDFVFRFVVSFVLIFNMTSLALFIAFSHVCGAEIRSIHMRQGAQRQGTIPCTDIEVAYCQDRLSIEEMHHSGMEIGLSACRPGPEGI